MKSALKAWVRGVLGPAARGLDDPPQVAVLDAGRGLRHALRRVGPGVDARGQTPRTTADDYDIVK